MPRYVTHYRIILNGYKWESTIEILIITMEYNHLNNIQILFNIDKVHEKFFKIQWTAFSLCFKKLNNNSFGIKRGPSEAEPSRGARASKTTG